MVKSGFLLDGKKLSWFLFAISTFSEEKNAASFGKHGGHSLPGISVQMT
jgi:hypothetical protein